MACALRTERFYDALGSAAFLSLALGSLAYGGTYFARQAALTAMVCVWTLRLGGFLLYRVCKTGGDSRFEEVKDKPGRCRVLVAGVPAGSRGGRAYTHAARGRAVQTAVELPGGLSEWGSA